MVWARVHFETLAANLRGLSDSATACYMHLWVHYLSRNGVVEDAPEALARVCYRSTAKWDAARKELLSGGAVQVVGDYIVFPFADEQIRHFRERSEKARRSVKARWSTVDGGKLEDDA
jgi:hypothetical protein